MTSKPPHKGIDAHSPHRRRKQSKDHPPTMRIALLGESVSENSRVGNFILGRAAFDSEAPPDVVERVGGRLKDRHVILINSPQLLQTHISDHLITQSVRECVYLSDPGPHVIVLLLKHDQCSSEDQECVEKVLDSFSERVYQHTMVLTTQEPTETNDILQKIIQKCLNRHFSLQGNSSPDDLLQTFEDIEKMNDGRHLDCAEASQHATKRLSEGETLNLVVCGSDGTLKSSISEQILQHTGRKSGVDLHGRVIRLVELPALFNTRLSEEEVMRQTIRCVSLCDPGVHVFLLIIPDAPLNNEDKAEMEEIQRIFGSRINKHIMILIMQNSEHQTAELNEETQSAIESFGGRHHFFGPTTQVSTLMENIEKMLEENREEFFSTESFLEDIWRKYEEMKKKIHSRETHLLPQGSTRSEDELRIVLLGKTGVGKSATGNSILGRNAFKAEESFESVTTESQSETSDINGRLVTVIDTPGLFDTELTNEEIQREIRHCISMILPGPHAFLLLIPLGRFTKEEQESVKIIQETFGEKSLMFTIVLFTRGDFLKNKTIEQCLGKPGSVIRNLTEVCGNRYHVFNNNQTGDRTQVSDLLEKIDNMVNANGGSFYSCKMFRQMEREQQEQQMKILMEKVEQLNSEREELMKKQEEEKERMKMMMEEEQKNHEKEIKRREEELKSEIREEEKLQREIRDEMRRERETFKHELEEMKEEKEKLQIKYNTEIDRLVNKIENERMKKEEYTEREEQYKTQIKEKEREIHEEMKREREEWAKRKLEEKTRREEEDEKRKEKELRVWDEFTERLKQERERMEREKEDLQSKHEAEENKMKIMMEKMTSEREELMKKHEEEKERMKMKMEEEQQNHDKEKKRREEEKKRWEREKQISDEQIQRLKSEMERIIREKERIKIMMEEERQNHEKERKRREEEFRERKEKYKREIKRHEMQMRDTMSREQKEREKQKLTATSAAIFGKIICQKLKDPFEQSVYKKTARDLMYEMRSNCESLNGNRSNLERHILKTLAEEEDFDKYMNYIDNPKDHFKSFIRDEVSRYITDKFSVSVLPKMKENVKLLQWKIMKAAHESTEHVQENRGDVGLWLKSFTQQLSDELIFSVKDLSGVKHEDVEDFNLLEDVITKELTAIISEISKTFNTNTFPVKLDNKNRPDEFLIDHFCQCCWVQCPFCGVTCTNTIENHDGDHSAPFHRSIGLNSVYYRNASNLSTHFCTSAVASDQRFKPSSSDNTVLYRNYRRAGGVYAKWRITHDFIEPPYWKWFVCRFQKDLEEKYYKTCKGSGEIPDEWRKYSKGDAIESLNKYL